MRWFLLVLLVFGCYGFSQSVSDEYTAEEVTEFLNSEKFLKTDLCSTVHHDMNICISRSVLNIRDKYGYGEEGDYRVGQIIQSEVVFGTPIKIHAQIQINDTLIKDINNELINWYSLNGLSFAPHGSFDTDAYPGETIAFIDKNKSNNQSIEYDFADYFGIDYHSYIVPISHRGNFEGYIFVDRRREYDFGYTKNHTSFRSKASINISASEAQRLAELSEEPFLYAINLSWLDPDFYFRHNLNSWFWVGESKIISAYTGDVFQLLDDQNNPTSYSDINPITNIDPTGRIRAFQPVNGSLILEGRYFKKVWFDYFIRRYSPVLTFLGWVMTGLTILVGVVILKIKAKKNNSQVVIS